MSFKPLILIIINIIIVLVLSLTSTHSTKQEDFGSLIEREVISLTEQDNLIEQYDEPIIEQDIGPFFCQNGTSLSCCPLLAHRVASEHHSRCASIILINKSGYSITLKSVSLEDGRWVTSDDSDDIDINCEPQTDSLANGQSEVFSSVTSHFLGGILGFATFTIHDDISSNFTISWRVPTIGSPGYSIEGLSKRKYMIDRQRGFENTVFQVIVEPHISYSFPFSFWTIIPPFLFLPCCCIFNMRDSSRVGLNETGRHNPNYVCNYSSIPNPGFSPTHMHCGVPNPGVPPEYWNRDQNQSKFS